MREPWVWQSLASGAIRQVLPHESRGFRPTQAATEVRFHVGGRGIACRCGSCSDESNGNQVWPTLIDAGTAYQVCRSPIFTVPDDYVDIVHIAR